VRSGVLSVVRITRKGIHRQWNAAVMASRQAPDYQQRFVDLLAGIGEPSVASGAAWRVG
jgi:hypothetical protein